jgi:uncharacterized protein
MARVISVIVLTGSGCNINCNYCYVAASRRNIKFFPVDKISLLIENCAVDFDEIEFCWHGGEPLLAGIKFYQNVIDAQRVISERTGVRFRNGIQSNGILLDREWISFLKNNNIGLGISFDAPPETHDVHRNGTSTKVLRALSLLRDARFPYGAICVISQGNVHKAEEIFNFFMEKGASSYSFLPLKNVPMPYLPSAPTDQELAELYAKTFDLWMSCPNQFRKIDPLYSMLLGLLGSKPPSCSFSAPCPENMIAIDQEGNIVPCGSLVEESFVLGNVFEESLSWVIQRSMEKFRNLRKIAIETHCQDCEFLSLCKGGCRADAYWATGHYEGAYPYCEARQITFRYIQKQLCRIGVLNP